MNRVQPCTTLTPKPGGLREQVDPRDAGDAQAAAEQGGGIVEVNAAPGLRMHLSPSYGKGRNVGEAIVSHLFGAGNTAEAPTLEPTLKKVLARFPHIRRLVVVAENHSVIGGLGEAVASALLRHRVQPAGFQLAGLPDAFLDAGALPTLHDRYGISREALARRIKAWLG